MTPSQARYHLKSIGVPTLGRITAPGKMEGGDVLWLDEKTVAIGRGYRTNDEGIRQFKEITKDVVEAFTDLSLWVEIRKAIEWSTETLRSGFAREKLRRYGVFGRIQNIEAPNIPYFLHFTSKFHRFSTRQERNSFKIYAFKKYTHYF